MNVRLVRSDSLPDNFELERGALSPSVPTHLEHLAVQLSSALLRLPGDQVGPALDGTLRTIVDRAMALTRAETVRVNQTMQSENDYLREEIRDLHGFHEIVGDAGPLREALSRVAVVASTDSTVLLLGETGTGKELFARAIHDRSSRQR